MGREALEDVLYRAQLELYAQPLLVRQSTISYTPGFSLISTCLCVCVCVLAAARKRHEELAARKPP